ncbi:kinase-like protein [Nadsonia fulvescens var. elongata DSM 6958]|uniref:Kinase-like protein n=1 Tax=Nadsonia fulvescens var. elongata DSM 6958 TaxID=857566 RepID=A0A1E3PP44_9ASCO|nr:kinase-like protein [Nadsonia fulvescens var. elongata DSM 6958]
MYGAIDRVNAQNAKVRLAESYQTLQEQFAYQNLKSIGNYNVSKLIGQGSFGKVYLASHKFTNTKVVLKSLPKNTPNLVREIHHHRQFKHPHIARLYEIIVTESVVWMVLEYCQGDELYKYLIENGRIPRDQARRIFSQLCGAVGYTHFKGCAHRDLKLENILLDKHRNVKLCDFGFIREYSPKSLLETVCGTTCYMAPEMLLRKNYSGEAVDVWSLGVILYVLMTGEMPFEEETDTETGINIITKEPSYPSIISAEDLPFLKALLSKDPKKRPKLNDILSNPFLQPYGITQKELLVSKPVNIFSTRSEKTLLKKMRSLHISPDTLYSSVVGYKCDSLAGWWELALEKEQKSEVKNVGSLRGRSRANYHGNNSESGHQRRGTDDTGSVFSRDRSRPVSIDLTSALENAHITNYSPLIKQLDQSEAHFDMSELNRAFCDEKNFNSDARLNSKEVTKNDERNFYGSRLENSNNLPNTDSRAESVSTFSTSIRGSYHDCNTRNEPENENLAFNFNGQYEGIHTSTSEHDFSRKRRIGTTIKHAMMKMVFLGNKSSRELVSIGNSTPNKPSITGYISERGSVGKNSSLNCQSSLAISNAITPDIDPDNELNGKQSNYTEDDSTESLNVPIRPRPISQISISSQFSDISFLSSNPSVISQERVLSPGVDFRRPIFSRNSTESSRASTYSESGHRKTHSKASSTSSNSNKSQNPSPNSSFYDSNKKSSSSRRPLSPHIPEFKGARHYSPFQKRISASSRHGLNESTMFPLTSKSRRRTRTQQNKHLLKVSNAGSMTSNRKGSIIEEESEGSMKNLSNGSDNELIQNISDNVSSSRGRSK